MTKAKCSLYLISPPKIDIEEFIPQLHEALSGKDVPVFQLRLKGLEAKEIRSAAEKIIPICKEYGTGFILNDTPHLAKTLGADGVHMGQEDGAQNKGYIANIKKKFGKDFIVGISCHDSKDLALKAAEEGADYVSFGAFFPTKTKVNPKGKPTLDILRWWHEYITVPTVSIGGINAGNCPELVKIGTSFIAVVSAVWENPKGPKEAVKELNSAIAKARTN